ncbi:AAA family ATPase [Streptomyces sp. 5-8]|uniref:AAA family ATPase n=1 Tax=Streptomyces musisoli TaxID=2802280 RepID=A0ABS1PBR4_9ACTN|nr:AAA family ATPase [Streptomyces musisoli]MBL1109709.1 AAA family ATPase [Streptomyces musisoli]
MDKQLPEAWTRGGSRGGDRSLRSEQAEDVCPYPGLASFGAYQAQWFFGRDELLARLIACLSGRLRSGGAVAVVGPTGVGKSSLLAAGLLPALAAGAIPGSDRMPVLYFTPTEHPMKSLALRLGSLVGVPPDSMAEALSENPEGQADRLREAVPARASSGVADACLVLVVDQLEEVFTLCPDEQERRDFLCSLSALAKPGPDGTPPVALVVYALSSNYLDDYLVLSATYSELEVALREPVWVGPLSVPQLREAIVLPAQAMGLQIESGLTELLLRDLEHVSETTRLPLLAHALREVWRRRQGHRLTIADYEATGGIRHAVATMAEQVFAGLDPEDQPTARRIFLQLVRVAEDIEPTRRRVTWIDLLGNDRDNSSAEKVLHAFTQSRVLSLDQETVEITQEALLWAWPRLRTWLSDERAGLLVRQQIEDAAVAWRRLGRAPSALYRGHELAVARSSNEGGRDLSPVATEFLDASVRCQRRAARLLAFPVLVLFVIALLTAGLFLLLRALPTAHGGWSLGSFLVVWAMLAGGGLLASRRSRHLGRAPQPEHQDRTFAARASVFLDGLRDLWPYRSGAGATAAGHRVPVRPVVDKPSREQSRRNVDEALREKYGQLGAPPEALIQWPGPTHGRQPGEAERDER